MSDTPKNLIDGLAIVSALGAVTEILPAIAALLAIVWTIIRIYEWARVVFWKKPPRSF